MFIFTIYFHFFGYILAPGFLFREGGIFLPLLQKFTLVNIFLLHFFAPAPPFTQFFCSKYILFYLP